ncbi:MAG: stage V sporulation protein R [Parcubacteria group bacterium Gr01-1014_3]|nr:MAG: stage V sporulation protein R [Parcubacteria group bacterium Gr01-1014_3]
MKDNEFKKLDKWIIKIEDRAREFGLKFRAQNFTVCSAEKMLEKEAQLGGYDLYSHWSFGKRFAKSKTLYTYKYHFLPYEMVINTDPCDACLLDSNPLTYNLLVAAHVYGHNDFFCNNLMFKDTEPKYIQMYLREGGRRIEEYIRNPRIGLENVESLLDAAHAVWMINDSAGRSFLDFVLRDFEHLSDYERDILKTVDTWSRHVRGNMKTKVMNEGWATYWHWKIVESFSSEIKSEFGPSAYVDEMLEMHRGVVRLPNNLKSLNPYRVGLLTWEKIWNDLMWNQKFSPVDFFNIRAGKTDVEFISEHFRGEPLIYEKFLKPILKANGVSQKIDVAGETEKYRKMIIGSCGEILIPRFNFYIDKTPSGRSLMLIHVFDGRELERGVILHNTVKLIHRIWPGEIILKTVGSEKGGKKNIALVWRNGEFQKIEMPAS